MMALNVCFFFLISDNLVQNGSMQATGEKVHGALRFRVDSGCVKCVWQETPTYLRLIFGLTSIKNQHVSLMFTFDCLLRPMDQQMVLSPKILVKLLKCRSRRWCWPWVTTWEPVATPVSVGPAFALKSRSCRLNPLTLWWEPLAVSSTC